MATLSFEERLGLLIERELRHCQDRRFERLLKDACLEYEQARIEDIDNLPAEG